MLLDEITSSNGCKVSNTQSKLPSLHCVLFFKSGIKRGLEAGELLREGGNGEALAIRRVGSELGLVCDDRDWPRCPHEGVQRPHSIRRWST